MNKLFNLTSTFKSEPQEDGSVMVRGMASTADFDRAGDSIISDAWTKGGLGNFEKNPIILFNHDYDKPIGRATKVTPTADGLHMEAKISKYAECANLIKDGVLGAFSVGFKVKDADYLKETDGLQIKDAELFEVSVVSVPCNQAATFSLAKAFDSEQDYEAFKTTFKSEELDSSSKEIDMSDVKNPEIDLEAFAKKVAEETAAKISMKQAEMKAAEKAEAEKAAEAEAEKAAKELEVEGQIKSSIKAGIETGAEKLMADIKKDFEEKQASTAEIVEKYKKDLEEKQAEIEAMQTSKKTFANRSATQSDLTPFGRQFLEAHILGKITGKGWDTDHAKSLMEKTIGVGATSGHNVALDTIVETQVEQDFRLELKAANFFRELPVSSAATIIPLQPDSLAATFGAPTTFSENLDGAAMGAQAAGSNTYTLDEVIVKAERLISTSSVSADLDEKTLVSLLPLITDGVARAHAVAVEGMITGNTSGASSGILGLTNAANLPSAATAATASGNAAGGDVISSQDILAARARMKSYGLDPSKLVIIASFAAYNDLLSSADFADITDVGSELATKVTGTVGTIFATPVVVTTGLAEDKTAGSPTPALIIAYRDNFIIPRLKGVSIETDYEVGNQRTVVVATQSLGFNGLVAGNATKGYPVAGITYTAS